MKPVIEVKDISKSYTISHQSDSAASYSTLKDDFAKLIKKPFGGNSDEEQEVFWALRDISFEVNQGEVFGIIGRNGSGKSTLLKILSRIVDPTKGQAILRGRAASLIEVGTGFHPELTGRENIYFNGSMLGMSRQEIRRKFDEIVDFSEVQKFLDTPVKFYSSGMYVRLAFSVAAHLDSEILVLDEVLSVGDASFQKKSLKKILGTLEEGRTVLFVSHGMDSVRRLCKRGMLLKRGKIEYIGEIESVVEKYIGAPPKPTGKFMADPRRAGKHGVVVEELSVLDQNGHVTPSVPFGKPFDLKVRLDKMAKLKNVRFDFNVFNQEMGRVACFTNAGEEISVNSREFRFHIAKLNLSPGSYIANVSLLQNHHQLEDFIPEAITFEVKPSSEVVEGATNVVYLKGSIHSDV